ncbi:hypothetical protein Pan241w_38580 [Gimesia alba]|uniref:Uncharacterized protein n=1 Tax=Gimesia alba TaxID=2527973 RepID=A0A517RIP9_9PLAN|nr:hypothetical protein [Gimesia alba]QDT43754.1 hypothetical protein Pan241w_38580 [Gimesia alba]
MLITNWLNTLVSRIQPRICSHSRYRRSTTKRWQAVQQSSFSTIEQLEVRQMLTSTLFLDFGAGFTSGELNTTVYDYATIDGGGYFDGSYYQGTGPNFNGFTYNSTTLGTSDTLTLKSLNYDYDGNSVVNSSDLTALANAVVPLIERVLEPFDIDVEIASANDFDDVRDYLSDNDPATDGKFDAYVFVTDLLAPAYGSGASGSIGEIFSLYGIAASSDFSVISSSEYHQGNQYDEAAHVFAETILEGISKPF